MNLSIKPKKRHKIARLGLPYIKEPAVMKWCNHSSVWKTALVLLGWWACVPFLFTGVGDLVLGFLLLGMVATFIGFFGLFAWYGLIAKVQIAWHRWRDNTEKADVLEFARELFLKEEDDCTNKTLLKIPTNTSLYKEIPAKNTSTDASVYGQAYAWVWKRVKNAVSGLEESDEAKAFRLEFNDELFELYEMMETALQLKKEANECPADAETYKQQILDTLSELHRAIIEKQNTIAENALKVSEEVKRRNIFSSSHLHKAQALLQKPETVHPHTNELIDPSVSEVLEQVTTRQRV